MAVRPVLGRRYRLDDGGIAEVVCVGETFCTTLLGYPCGRRYILLTAWAEMDPPEVAA